MIAVLEPRLFRFLKHETSKPPEERGATKPQAFVTSMVALDRVVPQELEAACQFFAYFFADQKSKRHVCQKAGDCGA